jgi:hypothetical protein
MRLSQWLARFLTPDTSVAQGRVRRRTSSTAPSLYVRRLEDRRVLSVDVVDGQTFTIAENSANGTSVGTVQVDQTAPAQSLTFSISAGNDANTFLIDPNTGEISIADSVPLDFETTPEFQLEVTAYLTSDPSVTDTSTVTIQLSDVFASAYVTMTDTAASLTVVDGHIRVTQGATMLFDAPQEDVDSLTITGSAGADTLSIDLDPNHGSPIPVGGLSFNGGDPTTSPGDTLVIYNAVSDKAVYTYDNATDGKIELTSGSVTSTINYTGLEPLFNYGTVTDVEFRLSGLADEAVLEDAGGGFLRLRSTSGTFETTTFTTPTGSLKVFGGDGNDTITVAALSGSFTLEIDGEGDVNTLVVDQTDAAVLAADLYRFAGFTFDQRDTPDQGFKLPVGFTDHGANVNAPPDQAVGAVFPENPIGFNEALTVGRLVNPLITSGTLALNMPAGDVGTTVRAGVELSWSNDRKLVNTDGNDFVIYEAASNPAGPDAGMVQVYIDGVGWSKWRYEAPDSFQAYAGSTEGALATAYDLSDFGVEIGQAITGIRYVNMMASDRMEGPGVEKTSGSGILVAEGFVIPEDGGATSNVFADPGAMASFPKYGNSTLDPDPLYFAMLHSLAGDKVLADSDTVTVTSSEVRITTDSTVRPTISYLGMNSLTVRTRGGQDDVTVELSSALPAGGVTVDGGDPSDGDRLTLEGTTGDQTITLGAGTASIDGLYTVAFSNFEQMAVNVEAVGAGDTVEVERPFSLPGNSASLTVAGDGDDKLVVDLSTGGGTDVDDVAIDHDSIEVAEGITVGYSGMSQVELYTGGGADTIRVTPSLVAPGLGTTYLIDGGDPTIATNPGDRVTLNIDAIDTPLMTITGIGTATLSSTTHASVDFVGIDSFGTDTPFDVTVDESANTNGAAADTFHLVRNGAADEISVNNAFVFRADLAAINLLTVVGSDQDDELTLDFSLGDPIPAGGVDFQAGDQVAADTLRLVGSDIDTVAHKFDDASTGSVTFGTTEIDYSAIEAVADEIESKRKTFTFTAGADDITLYDDAVAGDDFSQLTSNNSPTTRFLSPSETAEVDAAAGDDVVTLQGMDSQFAAELTIRGGTETDTISIVSDGTPGVGVEWISFPVFIDGGGDGDDRLVVEDSASTSSKTYSISNMNIGGQSPPAGAAVDTPSASPTVDGDDDTGGTGEWADVPIALDSGARPAPSLQTILHYDFSEANNPTPGGTAQDSTSNDLDGTLPVSPGPNFREELGRFGGALQFNGTTDFAWFQSDQFNVGAQGSLSFWVNLADASRRNQIIEGPGNNGFEFQYLNSGALGQFFGSPNNGGDISRSAGSAQATFLNTWTNVQFAWERTSSNSGTMRLYINGAEATYLLGTDSTIINWTTVIDTVDRFMTIGRDPVTAGRYLNGMIDDMAWFDKALTGAQLTALYTQTVASAQSTPDNVYKAVVDGGNLVAYWNMDDATGTTVAGGDGGTSIDLHTAPASARFMPTGGIIQNQSGTGVGGALEFNAPETFATFQDPSFDVGGQGTLNFWIYQRDTSRRNQIIEGPGDSGIEFQYRNSGSTNGQFYGSPVRGVPGSTDQNQIETAKPQSTFGGAWHNMQYTWDFATKTMHIYRDGVEVAYATNVNPAGWNSVVNTINGLFTVGRDPGAATQDRWFDGKLDDIAFFNTVLSQAERDAIRTNARGVGGAQADSGGVFRAVANGGNLIAYWNLDDPVGTTTVAGDGGTSITLNLNVPKQPEGAQFVDDGGPLLAGGTQLDSLDFDGDRDFIRTVDDAMLSFDKTTGSIALWVKPSAHAVDNSTTTGISSLLEDSNRQISLAISWQTDAGAALGNADLYGRIVFSPWENVAGASTNVIVSNTRLTSFPPNTWTHVAVTWDYATHTAVIYINGVAESPLINNTTSAAGRWTQPAGDTGNFIFGGDGLATGRWYDGEMADVAVFGNALRASDVQKIYTNGAGDASSFDLSGATGRFTFDATNLYGLITGYAPAGDANGPFSRLRLEVFLNDGTTAVAVLDTSLPDNGIAGSVVAANVDTSLYEFSIPLAELTGFDPVAGDYLTYRLTAYDADVPTGGFDTQDTTLGWVVEPPLAANGYRQMDFVATENFFATGGRLTYSGVGHLTVNGGSGSDVVTIVDSGTAVTNPTKTFTLNTGGGDDQVTIASIDSTFKAALTIDGQAGDDTVTINAALALGSADSTGDLTITAEQVSISASIDTTGSTLGGSVGNVTITVADTLTVDGLLVIGPDGDITATGDVLIDGGGDVETEGDITSTKGNVTIENATVLNADVIVTADEGDVTFDATVDSEAGEFNELTVSALLGTVTFEDAVGSIDPLGRVQIDAGLVVVNGVVTSEVAAGTGGEIDIHADEVELNLGGGLDVGDGLVTIVTLNDDVELVLGDDAVGKLGLDEDEVQRIVAGLLRFGDDRSGAISVVNTSTFYGSVETLHLTTGNGIFGSGVIDVEYLALTSVDDIDLTGSHFVDYLAAEVSASEAGITFTDDDVLIIAALIDGVVGITTDSGTTELIVGLGLAQEIDAAITSKYLRLAGTGVLYFLDEPTNDVDVLTVAIDGGDLLYVDADDLAIGDATSTEGITTAGGFLEIDAVGTLSAYRPIDAGAGGVVLVSLEAIEDTGPTGPKVIADSFDFGAVDGIGNTTPFETSVAHLSGINFSTGTISIENTFAGLLAIDLFGLTNAGGGGISVTHTGTLQVDAPIENSGGSGDIFLQAGGDLLVNDTSFTPDILNSGTGSIIGRAGGVVTLGPDVLIESGTGKLTGIPPLLSNVVAPQISNTGEAIVTFDYGRLSEFNFTALVDWSDGFTDLLSLGAPGSSGTNHFYDGNPNLADPAAPIPITVTLRADARIRFTGYETTTITVFAEFPGDGVRNVRIDTTAKVPQLVAPPPTRITDFRQSVPPVIGRSQVTGGAGLVAGVEISEERILILREVLPSGREGTEMQFNQAMLDRLDEIYAKLRNGRYRLYLYEPAEQKLRKVLDVYIKDGKPAAAEDTRERGQDRPDGARLSPDVEAIEAVAVAGTNENDDAGNDEDEAIAAPKRGPAQPSLAAGSLALGAGLVVASSQPWHEKVDAALTKFRRYSPLRNRSSARRTPR